MFARDPDAVIDLIELETTDDLMKQQENKGLCGVCKSFLDAHWDWKDDLSQDDLLTSSKMIAYCENVLDQFQMANLRRLMNEELKAVAAMSAWRIEGTLREFPRFDPIDLWFRYPVHLMDGTGSLKDTEPDYEKKHFQKRKHKTKADPPAVRKRDEFEIAFSNLELSGEPVLLRELSKTLGYSNDDTLKKKLRDGGEFSDGFEKYIKDNKCYVRRKDQESNTGTDGTEKSVVT